MTYATITAVKAASDLQDSKWDTVIQTLLDAAEEVINAACNRPNGFLASGTATTKLYAGTNKCHLWVGDCVEVTKVEQLVGSTWTELGASEWVAATGDPKRPHYNLKPYAFVLSTETGMFAAQNSPIPNWRVTARWGYAEEVPPQVVSACVAQCSRWFKRGQSTWADSLANADSGMLVFRKSIDPDIKMMLIDGRLVRPPLGD